MVQMNVAQFDTVCFQIIGIVSLNQPAGLFTDEDECQNGTPNCDVNAKCNNTIGSFTCVCLPGYLGDGLQCSGEEAFLFQFSSTLLVHVTASVCLQRVFIEFARFVVTKKT